MELTIRNVLALASVALCGGTAAAGTIFDTGTPDGGFFGYVGYDVFTGQSVGVAFTAAATYSLDSIGVWMMSNDWDNPGRTYTLSLHTNDPGSNSGVPSSTVLESWNVSTAAVGWTPVLDSVNSTVHPILQAGQQYWIVAESSEPGGYDPVWVWGSSFDGIVSGQNEMDGNGWQSGVTYGSAPGVVVDATLTPAPSALAGIGLGGLAIARRRR